MVDFEIVVQRKYSFLAELEARYFHRNGIAVEAVVVRSSDVKTNVPNMDSHMLKALASKDYTFAAGSNCVLVVAVVVV